MTDIGFMLAIIDLPNSGFAEWAHAFVWVIPTSCFREQNNANAKYSYNAFFQISVKSGRLKQTNGPIEMFMKSSG